MSMYLSYNMEIDRAYKFIFDGTVLIRIDTVLICVRRDIDR